MLLHSTQLWILVLGVFVPLPTYILNKHAPWVSEPTKAIVHIVVAAAGTALYQAIQGGTFGWNATTAELVLTAVAGALAAHRLLWKPSEIAPALGGGQNA